MKLQKLLLIVLLLSMIAVSLAVFTPAEASNSLATVNVSVNAATLLKSGAAGGARLGINTDYWWDDNANRTAGARTLARR